MRIYCVSCGVKSRIAKVEEGEPGHARLYCVCNDLQCGCSFVSELSFSHTLRPSKMISAESALLSSIAQLPEEARVRIIQELDLLT